MQIKVSKWGNSLALRLPQSIVDNAHLKEGSILEIGLKEESIIATPIKPITLEELLEGVTPENYGELIDFGEPVGNEIW